MSSPVTAMPIHGPQLNAVQWQRVLLSLLLVQAMLLLPVVLMLPSWLVLVPVVTGYWQWQVIRGRRRTLPRVIRWMLALGLPPLLWLDGLHPGALDFYVSLAFIGVALKLIEMRTYRDAFLVAMMALFVLAALLLLDQSIVFTLYVFAGASIALSALVRLHAPQGMGFMQTWRASGGALAIAAPFMLLLFVIFPRLPPVWQIPAASDMARTGLSETLAPGEIARLVQSDELVFRASFQSTEPAREDLYWRAMTLHHFDGRRWYQWDGSTGIPRRLVSAPQLPRAQANSAEWIYELALAATHQPWLATLEHLTEFSGGEVVWLADQRLAWPDNITQAQGLTVRSARHVTARTEVNDALRQAALQLPGQGNAQARALATGWLEEVDGNAQAFAERVMRHFAAEPFRYSLRPGRSGDLDNAIDRFLFTSQSGFCAHYAESMVFMARAAGIPARIVTGYLGGQWSSDGEYLVVRSQEAHAWAELWIDGAGWVRFDPTLMVAPDRIDLALSGVLQEEGDLRPAAWSDNAAPSWLQALYWRLDGVQYQWHRWVLNFDEADRLSLVQKWWGEVSLHQLLVGSGAILVLVFGSWLALLRWGNAWPLMSLGGLEKKARYYCLAQVPDLPVHEGLTLWVERLRSLKPQLAGALADFADSYLPLRYGSGQVSRQQKKDAKRCLAALGRVAKADGPQEN